jgi:hypothetical protein
MKNVRIEIPGRKAPIEFEVKESWDELNFDDLKVVQKIIFGDPLAMDVHRGEVLSQLTVLPKKRLRQLGELLMADDDGVEAMVQLYETIDFVLKLRPVFYHSACSEYRGFSGPADGLENLQWHQFAKAEMFFSDYLESRDEYDLNCLIAFIYYRDEYRPSASPTVYKVVQGWPLADRLAMVLNYMGLRNGVMGIQAEPEQPKEETEQEPDPIRALQASDEDPAEWALSLPFNIAGEKVGTIDQINKMMVPDVFRVLDQLQES